MSKYVTVPTVWVMYEVPDEVFAILNNSVDTPPYIALEMMVAHGIAKRVSTFTTSRGAEVGKGDSDDEEDEPKHPVW